MLKKSGFTKNICKVNDPINSVWIGTKPIFDTTNKSVNKLKFDNTIKVDMSLV